MDKAKYIKSLEKVKLILGNGFDLHCKLQSSYYDYYLVNRNKYDEINSKISNFIELLDSGHHFYEIDLKINQDNYNVWDFLFAFEKHQFYRNEKDIKWCDIEKLILNSLVVDGICYAPIDWSKVYKIYTNKLRTSDVYESIVANLIFLKKDGEKFGGEEQYYKFLLEELKLFENEFGSFILNRQININRRWLARDLPNDKYFKCVKRTLKDLCNLDNLVSIDSFNYSYFDRNSIENRIEILYNYINGNYESPIFGIDTILSPYDQRYIFTKSYRRMEANMLSTDFMSDPPFKHLVIYGHSLNEADHGYFFSMFDRMNLLNSSLDISVVFAYSIYNENKEKILHDLRTAVSKLVYKYALFKKIESPERLIDYLYLQNKILYLEIPELSGPVFDYPNYFDIKE